VVTQTSGSKRLATFAAGVVGLLGTLALACSPAAARQTVCSNVNLRVNAKDEAVVEGATLCLVDRVRQAYGLAPLRSDRALGSVARKVVSGMLYGNYFADVGPSGSTALSLVSASGYTAGAPHVTVGQNLAWGTGRYTTPARIVAAWMASPPHRANILDSAFHDAGVGVTPTLPSVLHAGRRGATYVFEFAARVY
jgi:uncharacterized protein YkwD